MPDSSQIWQESIPFEIPLIGFDIWIDFLGVFNSINFCYWALPGEPKWTVEYQGQQYDGAWAMLACLVRAIEESEGESILHSSYLANLSADCLANILRGNIEIPLFEERLNILRTLGTVLVRSHNGYFCELIKEAGNNAEAMLDSIISLPYFSDFARYQKWAVLFHKRAQLLVSDIDHLRRVQGLEGLSDIDQLTAFADYKGPQVLRKKGILVYSDELADKVDNYVLIEAGSPEEVEIRANMIWAIEIMKQKLKPKFPDITSSDIDRLLWLEGQKKSSGDKPYHRTRTIYY